VCVCVCKREREREIEGCSVEQKGVERHFYTGEGMIVTLLDGSQASPACPSGSSSSVRMKMYKEDVRMITVVA
jgi:hypothetical protein